MQFFSAHLLTHATTHGITFHKHFFPFPDQQSGTLFYTFSSLVFAPLSFSAMSSTGHWNTARSGKRSVTENKPYSPGFSKKRITPTKQEGKRQKAKPAHPPEENLEALELDMLSVIDQAPTASAHDGITANTGGISPAAINEDTANDPDDSLDRDPDVLAAIYAQNMASMELRQRSGTAAKPSRRNTWGTFSVNQQMTWKI